MLALGQPRIRSAAHKEHWTEQGEKAGRLSSPALEEAQETWLNIAPGRLYSIFAVPGGKWHPVCESTGKEERIEMNRPSCVVPVYPTTPFIIILP